MKAHRFTTGAQCINETRTVQVQCSGVNVGAVLTGPPRGLVSSLEPQRRTAAGGSRTSPRPSAWRPMAATSWSRCRRCSPIRRASWTAHANLRRSRLIGCR